MWSFIYKIISANDRTAVCGGWLVLILIEQLERSFPDEIDQYSKCNVIKCNYSLEGAGTLIILFSRDEKGLSLRWLTMYSYYQPDIQQQVGNDRC